MSTFKRGYPFSPGTSPGGEAQDLLAGLYPTHSSMEEEEPWEYWNNATLTLYIELHHVFRCPDITRRNSNSVTVVSLARTSPIFQLVPNAKRPTPKEREILQSQGKAHYMVILDSCLHSPLLYTGGQCWSTSWVHKAVYVRVGVRST